MALFFILPIFNLFFIIYITHGVVICPNNTLYNVTLQLDWIMDAQFAGYNAADYLRYYRDECLNVTIQPSGPGIDSRNALIGGQAQFLVAFMDQILLSRESGITNISLIAQMERRKGMGQISFKKSQITSVPLMRGKNVCVWGFGGELDLKRAVLNNNMIWDSDLSFEKNPANASLNVIQHTNMSFFLNGQCDSANIFMPSDLGIILTTLNTNNEFVYNLSDFDIFYLDTPAGIGGYEDGLYVNTNWLAANEDIALRFLRASFRGWAFARDQPIRAVEFLPQPTTLQFWVMNEYNKLLWPAPPGIGIVDRSLIQFQVNKTYEFQIITQWFDVGNGFDRQNISQTALNTILPWPNQRPWLPNKYGPGGTDYNATNFQGQNYTFCISTEGPIICPSNNVTNPLLREPHIQAGMVIVILIVALIVCIGGGCLWVNRYKVTDIVNEAMFQYQGSRSKLAGVEAGGEEDDDIEQAKHKNQNRNTRKDYDQLQHDSRDHRDDDNNDDNDETPQGKNLQATSTSTTTSNRGPPPSPPRSPNSRVRITKGQPMASKYGTNQSESTQNSRHQRHAGDDDDDTAQSKDIHKNQSSSSRKKESDNDDDQRKDTRQKRGSRKKESNNEEEADSFKKSRNNRYRDEDQEGGESTSDWKNNSSSSRREKARSKYDNNDDEEEDDPIRRELLGSGSGSSSSSRRTKPDSSSNSRSSRHRDERSHREDREERGERRHRENREDQGRGSSSSGGRKEGRRSGGDDRDEDNQQRGGGSSTRGGQGSGSANVRGRDGDRGSGSKGQMKR